MMAMMRPLARMLGAGSLILDKNLNSGKADVVHDEGKKYVNLNMLKEKYLHHPEITFNSTSTSFKKIHHSYGFNDYPISQNPLWTKSGKDIWQKSSSFTDFGGLNVNAGNNEKVTKKDYNTNASTLSLHIESYEKCDEVQNELKPKEIQKAVKIIYSKPSELEFQNPFEFPRQEKDKFQEPELSQFRASQRLFNPNEAPTSAKRNVEKELPANEPLAKKSKKEEKLRSTTPKHPSSQPRNEKLLNLRDILFSSSPRKDISLSNNQLQIAKENQAPAVTVSTENFNIEKYEKQINVLRKGMDDYDIKFDALGKEKQKLQEDLKKARININTLKHQIKRSNDSNAKTNETLKVEIDGLKAEIEKQQENFNTEIEKWKNLTEADHDTIQTLKNEISALKEGLQQSAAKEGITVIFENGKYTNKANYGMAKLKMLGVADEKMAPVIKTVFEMADLTANRLPSATTSARSWRYLAALNRAQLLEVLLEAAQRSISTTLGSDETTKNGKKMEAFVLYTLDEANKAREYCLGMVDTLDKSAATAIEKLKQIVERFESDEGANLWETFIMTVGNVMSDQANTQKLFNNLLEAIKKVIVENDERFNDLNDDEKKDLYKLRKFYCQLHILSNATPIVTNALLEHEKRWRNYNTFTEPSVVKLIKEVARLTGERAASKYDVHNKWVANAKKRNIKHANIPDFKGHRWMILFSVGGSVFYLQDDLLEFDKEFKTELRKVELEKWLKDPLTSSHLLVIAAVNEFITTPFWRLTEHDPSVNSITEHAQALIKFLERVIEDPMLLLVGEPPLDEFEEDFEITFRSKAHVKKLDSTVPQHPLIIKEVIIDVAEALLTYFKKQFKDFLPGGDHYESGENTKTVPRSNRKCESIFGLATWGFQHAPNQRTVVREAKIQATVNKVFDWFEKKTAEEKEVLFKEASAAAPKIEADAAAQAKALADATWDKMLVQSEADHKAEEVKSRKEKKAYEQVQKYGGEWKSIESMNAALRTFKNDSEKKKAVIANLQYHKLCLKNESSASKLFTVTFNRKPKPLRELIENLTFLIRNVERSNTENNNDDDDDDEDEY